VVRLQACALDTVSEAALLALSVETLHAVLDLVDRLLLAIEALDANQAEGVCEQGALDRQVKGALSRQGGTQVDLDEPRLEIRVNQDVKSKKLEAVGAVCASLLHASLDVVLTAEKSLEDDVVDTGPKEIHVDADLLEMLAEGAEGPLVAEVVLLLVLVLNKLLVLLVDRVVCQVHVLVRLVDFLRVRFGGEPGKALLENIDSHRLVSSNKHVDSQVELVPINQERVRDVLGDDAGFVDVHVVDIVNEVDATTLACVGRLDNPNVFLALMLL
jgi:hypothetical protein